LLTQTKILLEWRQLGPPKSWYPSTTLHGTTTQKTTTSSGTYLRVPLTDMINFSVACFTLHVKPMTHRVYRS